MPSGEETLPTLGFLTVLEHEQHGLVGGYLVLNTAGRPVEFHCTAPVKPTRAQQILFGPTLESYLYGEQIGRTLVGTSQLAPLAVCTDVTAAMVVRDFISLPVALVISEPASAAASTTWRVDAAHASGANLHPFTLGKNQLAVAAGRQADGERISEQLGVLAGFDLAEPFARIREAVDETHRNLRT